MKTSWQREGQRYYPVSLRMSSCFWWANIRPYFRPVVSRTMFNSSSRRSAVVTVGIERSSVSDTRRIDRPGERRTRLVQPARSLGTARARHPDCAMDAHDGFPHVRRKHHHRGLEHATTTSRRPDSRGPGGRQLSPHRPRPRLVCSIRIGRRSTLVLREAEFRPYSPRDE